MNFHYLLFGAFICSFLLYAQASFLENEKIKNGLRAGDKLLEAVDNTNFEEITPQIAELTLPFLEALTEMIQILQNKNSQEDLDKINEMLFKYNQHLRKLTAEFSDVRRMIDWNSAKINYAALENSIVALKQNMDYALNAPENIMDDQKQYYIKMFENDYHNAATKLYNSLVSEHMIFSENLIYLARKYTRNHRSLVHHFLLGVYKLIMEGLELEATYLIFKGYTSSISYIKKNWETRFNELQVTYQKADTDIVMKWFDQANKDVDLFIEQNPNATIQIVNNKLYSLITEKYYWRSWLVLVYKQPDEAKCRTVVECYQTIYKSTLNGGQFFMLVSALKKNFDENSFRVSATNIQNRLERKLHAAQPKKCHWLLDSLKSISGIYDGPCSSPSLKFAAVFSDSVDLAIRGDERHFQQFTHVAKSILFRHKFKVFLFA